MKQVFNCSDQLNKDIYVRDGRILRSSVSHSRIHQIIYTYIKNPFNNYLVAQKRSHRLLSYIILIKLSNTATY